MRTEQRQIIPIFIENATTTELFSDEQLGTLMRAYFHYATSGEVYAGDDLAVEVAFRFISNQFDRYITAAEKRADASRENGKKGGRPSKILKTKQDSQDIVQTQGTVQSNPVSIPSSPLQSSPNLNGCLEDWHNVEYRATQKLPSLIAELKAEDQ